MTIRNSDDSDDDEPVVDLNAIDTSKKNIESGCFVDAPHNSNT